MDIAGEWVGSIIYGKQYRDYEGEVLVFEMVLNQEGGRVTGESKDIAGFGLNEFSAFVDGEINGVKRQLNFVKTYEKTAKYNRDGKRKEYSENSASKIYYEGKANDDLNIFEGHWKIRRRRKFLFFALTFSVGEGTWSMRRKV